MLSGQESAQLVARHPPEPALEATRDDVTPSGTCLRFPDGNAPPEPSSHDTESPISAALQVGPDARHELTELGDTKNDLKEDSIDNDDMDSCELTPSMWDASVLLGAEELGMIATAFGMLVLVLNALIQLSFALFVGVTLTKMDFHEESVKSFRLWRMTIGHGAAPSSPSLSARTH